MIKIYKENQTEKVLAMLQKRTEKNTAGINKTVREIIKNVRANGDSALFEYAKKFDKVVLNSLYLTDEEFDSAERAVSYELKETMRRAADNIREYHEKQLSAGYEIKKEGIVLGRKTKPLARVGLYVPGGTAAYPSSVLMNAIPAKVAGVDEIVIATPCKEDGIKNEVIYAARLAGVKKILKVGGAQAIAALAYGTESVEKVDKIVGPGNAYVSGAKREVFGIVDIDMIAGPSEVTIIADSTANPAYIAADLMSQAEHDVLASSILLTDSAQIAKETAEEIKRQIEKLERKEIIDQSLKNYGAIIVVSDISKAVELSDKIAPEHLELSVENPFELLKKVNNAGSIFLGHYTPEPLGDYFAGTNHVLPTNGTARFSSPLSVESFVKHSSYLAYDAVRLADAADDVIRFAECEGLTAHANSIKVRKNKQ